MRRLRPLWGWHQQRGYSHRVGLRAGVALPHPEIKKEEPHFLHPCPPFREFRWRIDGAAGDLSRGGDL